MEVSGPLSILQTSAQQMPGQASPKLPVPTDTNPLAAGVLSLKAEHEPVPVQPETRPEPVEKENLGSNINVFA